MTNRIGQQIGNYQLIRLIGHGRIGDVYLAEHRMLGRRVAVKVLHDLPDDGLQAFRTEARTIAGLNHPNILTIFDFGIIATTPYIVMSYAPNGSLQERHPLGSQVPLASIIEYVRQIASALQYMHDQSLLHLDIKPGNILIGNNNELLLSEPDIAFVSLSMRTQTVAQEIVGTPRYMAPEQIVGRPSRASDQYALGVTVYEWLSGHHPFDGNNAMQLFAQHLQISPPPLRTLVPLISIEVEAVVMRALAKRPEDRFPTVASFAQALEQAAFSDKSFSGQYVKDIIKPTNTAPMTPVLPPSMTPSSSGYSYNSAPPLKPGELAPSFVDPYSPSQYAVNANIIVPGIVPPKKSMSRRTFVTSGLIGLAALVGAEVFASTWKNRTATPSATPTPSANGIATTVFVYTGHAGSVEDVAWSPDGIHIASAGADHKIQLWNGLTGAVFSAFSTSTLPLVLSHGLAWSPNSKRIAFADGETMQVWNADHSGHAFVYSKHNETVNAVAWSPDGTRIASASADKTVQVCNVDGSGQPIVYPGHTDAVNAVAWSPDNKRIVSGSADKTVRVWYVNGTGAFIALTLPDIVNTVAWSPDGNHIAAGLADKTVQVWNATDGSLLYIYKGHTETVNAVTWSPDSRYIASGSADNTVQVWYAVNGSSLSTYTGHINVVNAVSWSPDGKYIASGSTDKTVHVWRAP